MLKKQKQQQQKTNHRFSQSYKKPYSITDLFFSQTSKTEQKGSDLKAGSIRPSNHSHFVKDENQKEGANFLEIQILPYRFPAEMNWYAKHLGSPGVDDQIQEGLAGKGRVRGGSRGGEQNSETLEMTKDKDLTFNSK